MKLRACLLIAILFGGTYVMIQNHNDYKVKMFSEILESMDDHFVLLTFNKPATPGSAPKQWVTEDEVVVEDLIKHLQNYRVQRLKPEEQPEVSDPEQFSLILEAQLGNQLSIMAEENIVIVNSSLYYEIVDGPLEANWLVHFFISNQNPR
ncbi:hypothetical protein [Sporosarcina sp. G11-34]|uniref:hypothetical protein n=1 Tax=Sporosarcina sp. G11-34 TaxID=2849605 RepID=UPI0022A97FE4|nr:hypothetical protein [Sporosarcina sp. G11-34]MCZ2257883.1 hypothetical protein [Sporosarcina sp. G11-34]